MLPNKAILGWINCLEQTSWNLYDLILHVRKMSLLKQSLGKVPTLGSVTLGCLCWPSPDLDRAAWLSMHCSAFCHPFPGIMSGITNRSKASSHFPPPPLATPVAEVGCREGGLVLHFAGSVGADPTAKGIWGHIPSSRHCLSLSWCSYFCLNFPGSYLQRSPV